MTFKGYIRRVYVLHIETKIHTEPLIQYVCSSIKYPFTCPFFWECRLSTLCHSGQLPPQISPKNHFQTTNFCVSNSTSNI